MASNSFGTLFRLTTWGESHGKAIGAVIDGCPAGLELSEKDINRELFRRKGGKSPLTTPRQEKDEVEIFSGLFEGKTTGAPISMLLLNQDRDSSKYHEIQSVMRPGHANFTYLKKYGIFDYKGGGRSSARETACRVMGGAVAKKLLHHYGIRLQAYLYSIGSIVIQERNLELATSSPIFCPDKIAENKMFETILKVKEEEDSLGGIVECLAEGVPPGLGDPIYEKLEANLAKGMLSIPASKGFEIGEGFHAASMRGSSHNDGYQASEFKEPMPSSNRAGGVLGGISTGLPLVFRVAFKPTSSIGKSQDSVDLEGNPKLFKLPKGSRHDPCVAIRAVPVVEAMAALTLADALLLSHLSKL